MFIALISIVYAVDLLLFVLVFLMIRSRRASGKVLVTLVLLAVVAYLTSLAFLVFISYRFS